NYPSAGGGNSGSQNNGPVVSGSSDASNRSRESEGIQSALSSDAIDRFFPGLSGGGQMRRRSEYKKPIPRSSGAPIPFPPHLTPEWIAMHGYNPERVEDAHRNACELVELLNNSTYTSPY
ncbi:hypothetical protein LPJ61_004596, partial [Coemansia biformis]